MAKKDAEREGTGSLWGKKTLGSRQECRLDLGWPERVALDLGEDEVPELRVSVPFGALGAPL